METMNALPDLEGRRFGSLTIGYDRISRIREEHSTLLSLAAVLCGVSPEAVTQSQVANLTAQLQSKVAATTSGGSLAEQLAALPDTATTVDVIACALAFTQAR